VSLALLGALALLLAAAPGPDGSDAHLVAGAEAFRAGAYEKALSAEASWYAAASLLQLGRADDAVEAFVLAERTTRTASDALLVVYRGQACYAARLYACADRWFEWASSSAGPRLAPQLKALRAAIREALQPGQLAPVVDRLLGRAGELSATRPALASAYAEEAVAMSARSPSRYREAEATALASRLAPTPPRGRR